MSGIEKSTKLDLERIVFIGRTYEEYIDMFSLSPDQLKNKKILDCPAGVCSFTAVGCKTGLDITACDIAYDHAGEDLYRKGLQDVEHAMKHMETAKGNYKWDYFSDIAELKEYRLSALQDCVADMQQSPERYIPVLPVLPFQEKTFDLLLSAHFLFMYSDRLDYSFHIDSLNEMLRVTKEEIRIFPLVDLAGNRYERLDDVTAYLRAQGHLVEEVPVGYEFQENANSMLRIRKSI